MNWGFTGTRHGMTERQQNALRLLIERDDLALLHHGDCYGADRQAHEIVTDDGKDVAIHPPDDSKARANCKLPTMSGSSSFRMPPAPYLVRNHAIVDACSVLIAAPRSLSEEQRSGTWATVRYARKIGRPVIILDP